MWRAIFTAPRNLAAPSTLERSSKSPRERWKLQLDCGVLGSPVALVSAQFALSGRGVLLPSPLLLNLNIQSPDFLVRRRKRHMKSFSCFGLVPVAAFEPVCNDAA